MAHDVFISYSSKDKVVADAVCARLEEKGVRCWIAPRDILPGAGWAESIIDAIHACRIMVVVFSSHSDASQQVRREAERAVSQGAIILPFRIEDVYPSGAMEYFLSTSHWLDALTAPLESHLQSLTETVTRLLQVGETQTAEESMRSEPRRPDAPDRTHRDSAENGASGRAVEPTVSPALIAVVGTPAFPAELRGFNWGAFLLNRSWLGAHNSHLGLLARLAIFAPYVALVVALVFGTGGKVAWVLALGVLVWVIVGMKANRWAWENRRWINADHFKKVQRTWLVRGVIFWAVVAVASVAFVKSGLNVTARAEAMQMWAVAEKQPLVASILKQVGRVFTPPRGGRSS